MCQAAAGRDLSNPCLRRPACLSSACAQVASIHRCRELAERSTGSENTLFRFLVEGGGQDGHINDMQTFAVLANKCELQRVFCED